jgi:hypothetical protein
MVFVFILSEQRTIMHNMPMSEVLDRPADTSSSIAARLPYRGRPCDRLERWAVSGLVESELATACADAGLPVGTGSCLLAERGLLLEELGTAAAELLDTQAETATVTRALSDASAIYLRSLSMHMDDRHQMAGHVCLPARLTDRLLAAGGPGRFLLAGAVDQARRWERAAVAAGATMTEWAQSTLLEATRFTR